MWNINWNLSQYFILGLYSLIDNWFIISKSFLSINFHAFRYLQTTIRKLFPKLKCHYRWKLACTASCPDSIFLMIERRSEFFRFFQFSVVSIFHRINYFKFSLTQFEPPSEFNTSITHTAFGTHLAAVLASVLLLSADRWNIWMRKSGDYPPAKCTLQQHHFYRRKGQCQSAVCPLRSSTHEYSSWRTSASGQDLDA